MAERPEALRIIGAVGAACAFPFPSGELYGQHASHGSGEQAASPAPSFFSEHETRLVTRLADLIIPRTRTPGAVDAGVPAYIDSVVSRNPQAGKLCREGLAWLDRHANSRHGRPFLELSAGQQVRMLEPLCEEAGRLEGPPAGPGVRSRRKRPPLEVSFFHAVKSMTADGYYTSKMGLIDELGYAGNTVLAEFPACTHEH